MDDDDQLRAWVSAELGPTHAWTRLDDGRTRGVVHALIAADGSAWIAKRFASARGFAQERRALREWFNQPGAPGLGGARVPRLHADHAGIAALLVERLPGHRVDPDDLDPAVHRAAGQFLAALHGLPVVDADPLSLAKALTQRVDAWRARVSLSPIQAEIADRHGPRPELFQSVGRVACHRDYAPRNWLWDGTTLAVVDFEHARLDLAVADLTKLCVDVWGARASLRSAFFDGYGRPLTALEHEQLRACVVVHGLASLAWGQEKRDPGHVEEGHRALDLAAAWPR